MHDTLSVAPARGRSIKHFDADDPKAKLTVARPYRQDTAKNAADFLAKVLAEMPHPIKAIKIGGGSEFMAEFETACAAKKSHSMFCRRDRPSSMEPSNGATACGDMSPMQA